MVSTSGTLLRAFLEDSSRPSDTLKYHELQGFLFAVASAPELVKPSEWMPIESRFRRLGMSVDGRVLMVAYTVRRTGNAETIRVIGARRASRRERAAYQAQH